MMSKQVAQLDAEGYFIRMTEADEHPLKPGDHILPGGAVDASKPNTPVGHVARWDGHGWQFEPMAPIPDEKLAADARKERDAMLVETDYTQLSDAPVNAQAWANYRQALRDLPEQSGFPGDITWPTPPE